jgi:mRNA interferase MazF
MVSGRFVPDRGDVVWIDFDPQSGREQAGLRPALILTPAAFNKSTDLAIACPVTPRVRGIPSETRVPEGLPVHGVILTQHVRSLDWRSRRARFACRVPTTIVDDVVMKVRTLIE